MSLRALGVLPFLVACAHVAPGPANADAAAASANAALVAAGEALFTRTWTRNDPMAGGDGLGPLYNAESCVACHHQGGAGGSGPRSGNVELLVGEQGVEVLHRHSLSEDWEQTRMHRLANAGPEFLEQPVFMDGASDAHSFDLIQLPGEVVERNPPSLRTLALIASVPDGAIHRLIKTRTSGRRSEDADGRLRRLGWKGTESSVQAFVAKACAVELGLSTPQSPQADEDGFPDLDAATDLDAEAVAAITAYVLSLEPEAQPEPDLPVVEGDIAFEELGCTDCHVPDPGGVSGLYTDLMLHDMGDSLSDPTLGGGGGYGLRRPPSRRVDEGGTVPRPSEWLTPTLMEVSRTGPWMHDGRAKSLHEAILMHDGAGRAAAMSYRTSDDARRMHLLRFLATL